MILNKSIYILFYTTNYQKILSLTLDPGGNVAGEALRLPRGCESSVGVYVSRGTQKKIKLPSETKNTQEFMVVQHLTLMYSSIHHFIYHSQKIKFRMMLVCANVASHADIRYICVNWFKKDAFLESLNSLNLHVKEFRSHRPHHVLFTLTVLLIYNVELTQLCSKILTIIGTI